MCSQVVPKEAVTPEHFTMSPSGVVHVTPAAAGAPAAAEFIPLATWLHELSAYNAMRRLRAFRLHLPRKAFRTWRDTAHAASFERAREALEKRAFCVSQTFVRLVVDAARLIGDAVAVPLMPWQPPREVRRCIDCGFCLQSLAQCDCLPARCSLWCCCVEIKVYFVQTCAPAGETLLCSWPASPGTFTWRAEAGPGVVDTVCQCRGPISSDLWHLQVWQRQGPRRWALVPAPGTGDAQLSANEYVKQQQQHSATLVAQAHSLAVKQLVAKVARTATAVNKGAKHLKDEVAVFKADPSHGASQVGAAPVEAMIKRVQCPKKCVRALLQLCIWSGI
jgi:hypothetical protein